MSRFSMVEFSDDQHVVASASSNGSFGWPSSRQRPAPPLPDIVTPSSFRLPPSASSNKAVRSNSMLADPAAAACTVMRPIHNDGSWSTRYSPGAMVDDIAGIRAREAASDKRIEAGFDFDRSAGIEAIVRAGFGVPGHTGT